MLKETVIFLNTKNTGHQASNLRQSDFFIINLISIFDYPVLQ